MINQKDWKQFKKQQEEWVNFHEKSFQINKAKKEKKYKEMELEYIEKYNAPHPTVTINNMGTYDIHDIYNILRIPQAPYPNTLEGCMDWIVDDKPIFIKKVKFT